MSTSSTRRIVTFLAIGGLAFVVDAATYNILVFGPTHDTFNERPITAKVIAIAAATVASYVGNARLTYADRDVRMSGRQLGAFAVVNVLATLLQLGCLAFSRYVLDLDSPLADNVSGTLVGQSVATVFRYLTYGRLVFRSAPPLPTDRARDDGSRGGPG
jgi:putative flippase GtrA